MALSGTSSAGVGFGNTNLFVAKLQGIDNRSRLYPCNLGNLRLNPFRFFGLKYPTYAAEEAAPRPELRCKDPNPCAFPHLVALIEDVRHIEANPKPAVLFRQVKIMG